VEEIVRGFSCDFKKEIEDENRRREPAIRRRLKLELIQSLRWLKILHSRSRLREEV
jgi:hypothetical protein